jgi:hypothetical protein
MSGKKEKKDEQASKDRDAAVAWLRDKWQEAPADNLFETIFETIWVEILQNESTNACETTPHLKEALLTLARMQEKNRLKPDGRWGKAMMLLGVYEFRMSKSR